MDDKFIDVDFATQPEFTFGDCGTPMFCSFGDEYEKALPNLTRSEMATLSEKAEAEKSGTEWLVTRIYNQGQEGSCVANACSQAHEILQAIQFGKSNVTHLSAMSLYKRIGRSPGSGAMVSDGLLEMSKRGILPLDTPENRAKYGDCVMQNTGFRSPFPANWEVTAAKFKGVEALVVRTMDGLMSALLRGHPVVVGRSGHSIAYASLRHVNGRFTAAYPNSWGSWGSAFGDHKAGWGFDSESYIRSSSSWAFALRSVTAG